MTHEVAVKERPILFSGPMVRAILEGRKTQTRRVMKPQPHEDDGTIHVGPFHPTVVGRDGEEEPGEEVFGAWHDEGSWKCPYGAPGDRLWVKERWGLINACYGSGGNWASVGYHATPDATRHCLLEVPLEEALAKRYFDEFCDEIPKDEYGTAKEGEGFEVFRWRSSRFMPRWASRLTLEIVRVRVDRVQDISDPDVRAEGLETLDNYDWQQHKARPGFKAAPPGGDHWLQPNDTFASLWDSINAKRGHGWAANPWVWVVEFRRLP